MYLQLGWLRFSSKTDALGKSRVWIALDCPYFSEVKYWVLRG